MKQFKIQSQLDPEDRPGLCALYSGIVIYQGDKKGMPPHDEECRCIAVPVNTASNEEIDNRTPIEKKLELAEKTLKMYASRSIVVEKERCILKYDQKPDGPKMQFYVGEEWHIGCHAEDTLKAMEEIK